MSSSSSGGVSASPLSTAQLAGSAGYVATNGFTVYVLSSDSFNNSTCASNGCAGVWPVLAPPGGGAPMSTGWSSFVRADGKTQLSYNGWPLYTYSGDSAAGQSNGNGITSFGGVWSIARPGMAAAAGTPSNDYNP
jgi:predicted lipoprotein with Yx(FWY)xxD motif